MHRHANIEEPIFNDECFSSSRVQQLHSRCCAPWITVFPPMHKTHPCNYYTKLLIGLTLSGPRLRQSQGTSHSRAAFVEFYALWTKQQSESYSARDFALLRLASRFLLFWDETVVLRVLQGRGVLSFMIESRLKGKVCTLLVIR